MTDQELPATQPATVDSAEEFKAMAAIASALDALPDPPVRRRVITWVVDRYGFQQGQEPPVVASRRGSPTVEAGVGASEFGDFAEMYHAASPRSDRERLLTAGHWLQVHQSEQDLHADNVNEILTPLGERIERVRDVLPTLLSGRPALAIRTGKGKGSRGRVTFRLTTAGLAAVDAAIAAGGFDPA